MKGHYFYLTTRASHFTLAWLCYTNMPAHQLVSKLLNGQHMSHLCITNCLLNDTYAEYIFYRSDRQIQTTLYICVTSFQAMPNAYLHLNAWH
jgi:hypothetical protein